MTVINWGTLFHYTFGMSGIDYEVPLNFRVLFDGKRKSNLKLPKDKIP